MLVALLAQVVTAVPITPAEVTYDPGSRYIPPFQGSGKSGEIVYALTIDRDGRVIDCRIVTSTAPPPLPRLSCESATAHFAFNAARNEEGRPEFALVRHRIVWRNGNVRSDPRPPGADVVLTLAQMPAGWAVGPAVRIDYIVRADGKMALCGRARDAYVRLSQNGKQATPLAQPPAADDRLWRTACAAVPTAFPPQVAHDASGKAVASVQSANVIFEVAAPGPQDGGPSAIDNRGNVRSGDATTAQLRTFAGSG